MLELPGVTLACIDTANPFLALRALAKSCEGVQFARVVLFTTESAISDAHGDVEIVPIPALGSRDAYSQFLLKDLAPHIATGHVLIAQWDGYVVNPLAWDPANLECDYLGAKWFWHADHMRVGNGGFSLRSRRLLEALRDPRVQLREAEDTTICRTFRPLLERDYGIRFGDEAVADRFSFEAAHPIGRPFGFHGLFNFCRVMPAGELAELASMFTDAIVRSPQCAQLLRNCIALAQWAPAIAIARRILASSPNDEARALLAHAEAGAAAGIGIGRNDPCPCGSGRRFKQCHGAVQSAVTTPAAASGPIAGVVDPFEAGIHAHQRGDLDGAERAYRSAMAANPEHPYALHYLGVIHYQRDSLNEAFPLLERAVALRPDEPEFHNNLGLALARANRDADAVEAFGRALALRPDHVGALNNLGLSLRELNRVDEAIAAYRRALALQPGFLEARWNLALALLANGDYAEGWREYETRLDLGTFQSGVPRAPGERWRGDAPRERTLLLTSEQGLGDAIQFIRLAKTLHDRGARVIVRAQEPLVAMLRSVPGVEAVLGPRDPLPPYDAHVPILSLPGLLGIDASNIPSEVPYVATDPLLQASARDELARIGTGVRVGLVWRGNSQHANDRRRSVPLANLLPLLSIPGARWVSLQKGDDEAAGIPGLARPDARNTMDGIAALVAELDLVVSVDTSIGHLAGALGRRTFLLLPFAADWRWGIAGTRTPWYPNTRLFRQPSPGDWAAVIADVRSELLSLIADRSR